MIRVGLIEIVLLATPFLLYWLYRALVGRKKQASESGEINETPYQILFLTGSAVALASLVAVVLIEQGDHGQAVRDRVYIPPRVVDGEVVPGYFLSREEAIARGLVEADNGGGEAEAGPAPDTRAP